MKRQPFDLCAEVKPIFFNHREGRLGRTGELLVIPKIISTCDLYDRWSRRLGESG